MGRRASPMPARISTTPRVRAKARTLKMSYTQDSSGLSEVSAWTASAS